MLNQPKVILTELDERGLRRLLDGHGVREIDWPQLQVLEAEVDRADIVPSHRISRDVVRMYSRVRIVDLRTGEQLVYQIVYPHEANYSKNKISVLAPIGTALLG
jgi:regulator of nucleoside diphosphate kinase